MSTWVCSRKFTDIALHWKWRISFPACHRFCILTSYHHLLCLGGRGGDSATPLSPPKSSSCAAALTSCILGRYPPSSSPCPGPYNGVGGDLRADHCQQELETSAWNKNNKLIVHKNNLCLVAKTLCSRASTTLHPVYFLGLKVGQIASRSDCKNNSCLP